MSSTVEFSMDLRRRDADKFVQLCSEASRNPYFKSFWEYGCGCRCGGTCPSNGDVVRPIEGFLADLPSAEHEGFSNAVGLTDKTAAPRNGFVRLTFTKNADKWASRMTSLVGIDHWPAPPPTAATFAPLTRPVYVDEDSDAETLVEGM